jgi:hypothetical protein
MISKVNLLCVIVIGLIVISVRALFIRTFIRRYKINTPVY